VASVSGLKFGDKGGLTDGRRSWISQGTGLMKDSKSKILVLIPLNLDGYVFG
jgi:hypothetical protein